MSGDPGRPTECRRSQGVVFILGNRWVTAYKLLFLAMIVASTSGLITGPTELLNVILIGTGAMLFANVPITLLFSDKVVRTLKTYLARQ